MKGVTYTDISSLLNTVKECSCGRKHSCSIKEVVIGEGALQKLPEMTRKYHNIIIVADKNTYEVCGRAVEALVGHESILVYSEDKILIPDETAVDMLKSRISAKTDLILGVGSGVIQDLCKYVSFLCELPYYIVATAPSMDGYASDGAAMIAHNMKITYPAHVPEAIIADTEVLRNAPMEMIVSGFGDIIGKFSCLNDWKLSAYVNGEYFCDEIYGLVYDTAVNVRKLGKDLLRRDGNAVCELMKALVTVGIAMSYAGNSRPASGSEHHLSHYFEITGILNNEPYFLHGTDVLYSTVMVQKLREELLKKESIEGKFVFDEKEWEENIRRVYGRAAEGVIELQRKAGSYSRDIMPVYAAKWKEIRAILSEVPSSQELDGILADIRLDMNSFYKMYSKQKLEDAVLWAKDLKDRYSVLWLYFFIKNAEAHRQ